MPDNRRKPRKQPNHVIEIHDILSGSILGQLANITTEGLMLIGPEPIPPGTLYQLRMPLLEPTNGISAIDFGVESLWHQSAGNSDRHWTGFQIIDISPENSAAIENISQGWKEI